jgi:hypothetical protein
MKHDSDLRAFEGVIYGMGIGLVLWACVIAWWVLS